MERGWKVHKNDGSKWVVEYNRRNWAVKNQHHLTEKKFDKS